ncbi:MAG: DUF4258 domain-containing protein [Acidobacteria bacterium]|nr:DUF4258 domain-containing protein [Acidobacteriota bacterium]
MTARTLNRIRDNIRRRQYVLTLHAEEEMDNDGLSIFDVESIILTVEIVEQQRDRATREVKYLIRGDTLASKQQGVVVAKFGMNGKLVILTVYAK